MPIMPVHTANPAMSEGMETDMDDEIISCGERTIPSSGMTLKR